MPIDISAASWRNKNANLQIVKLGTLGINVRVFYLLPTKEEVYVFARICLSVCLSVYITQKRVHGFG